LPYKAPVALVQIEVDPLLVAGLTHSLLHHNLFRDDLFRHSMLGSSNNLFLQIR
jgi:hypothetical protein